MGPYAAGRVPSARQYSVPAFLAKEPAKKSTNFRMPATTCIPTRKKMTNCSGAHRNKRQKQRFRHLARTTPVLSILERSVHQAPTRQASGAEQLSQLQSV